MSKYKTEQEHFWVGEFGKEYIQRNNSKDFLASNIFFLAHALKSADKINSCIEFGANIGINLTAMNALYHNQEQYAIEINPIATKQLRRNLPNATVIETSILDFKNDSVKVCELALIKTVLIHINPNHLENVYSKIRNSTSKYILIAEYYNPKPVSISYRGHQEKLFKRDFCGELMEKYPELALKDYGFIYHRDSVFPQDDITWFLLQVV